MIFGATTSNPELTTFQNLLDGLLAALRVIANSPATAEGKANANKTARASAEAALAKISPANQAAANQAFITFRNEVGKIVSAGPNPGAPPTPPPAPAITTASMIPTASSVSSFFTENAKALKIGGGVALAGVVGYVLWRRMGKRARMF
jgi:hypothetical protein